MVVKGRLLLLWLSSYLGAILCPEVNAAWAGGLLNTPWFRRQQPSWDYDLVVIGAGASGLYASGTAASLGLRTLVLDKQTICHDTIQTKNNETVGGDCTNAACVPSKAVRSIARVASSQSMLQNPPSGTYNVPKRHESDWLKVARQHADHTIHQVRERESPDRLRDYMDLEFITTCRFHSKHELVLEGTMVNGTNATGLRTVRAKQFLIATGSGPIVPEPWLEASRRFQLPLYTYRSLLQQSSTNNGERSVIWNGSKSTTVVVAGGGATACELSQSLARLGIENITIVAPGLLSSEDVSLQQAAHEILQRDGVQFRLGCRVETIIPCQNNDIDSNKKARIQLDTGEILDCDAFLVCIGRTPDLKDLHLEKANISWDNNTGVHVNSYLESKTARHVYTCGDCASAVPKRDRRAIHAGWMGFHAVRNMAIGKFGFLGKLLLREPAIHPVVPRVVYTDPELASIGLSYAECIAKYGTDGFARQSVSEIGSDRADTDALERNAENNFVELRAHARTGRILGGTAVGPAAAELINAIGLAIQSKLTVRHIATSLHSYPSHGYLLYRVALSMATTSLIDVLSTCGILGRAIFSLVSVWAKLFHWMSLPIKFFQGPHEKRERIWRAKGSQKGILVPNALLHQTESSQQSSSTSLMQPQGKIMSFLEIFENEALSHKLSKYKSSGLDIDGFIQWLHDQPSASKR